jgi:hypothetical protein
MCGFIFVFGCFLLDFFGFIGFFLALEHWEKKKKKKKKKKAALIGCKNQNTTN